MHTYICMCICLAHCDVTMLTLHERTQDTYARTLTQKRTCIYASAQHTHAHTHIHTQHAQTYTHTYKHIHTHTHTCMVSLQNDSCLAL